MKMLPKFPATADIPVLPVRIKPDWKGIEARFIGMLVWIGELLGIEYATTFMDEFVTVLGGVIYNKRGATTPISNSLMMHEGIHHWQSKNYRWFRLRYLLSRNHRMHFEAQAYAYEVYRGSRTLNNAALSMASPIYMLGISVMIAKYAIREYSNEYRRLFKESETEEEV